MRSYSVLGLSLAFVVIVGACSSGGAASPAASAAPAASTQPSAAAGGVPPTREQLDARTFIVTGTTGHDLVVKSEVSLRFEDGLLAVSAGCNQMSGAYEVKDGVLQLRSMVTTAMACEQPLMDQDRWISAFLPGATVTLDGDTLTLSKDGVMLTATDKKVAMPDKPIEGTTWVVDALLGNQVVSSVPEGVTATLVFAAGRVVVDTSCNKGNGAAAIAGTSITFGPIAITMMACSGPSGEVERQVLAVLAGDVSFTIDADVLHLRGTGGGLDLHARP